MTHIVYKTTNLINNKIYIGVHSYKRYRGYIGSGSHFSNAVKKHGKENFIFEILHYTDTAEQSDIIEEMLVTEEFVSLDTNYNEVPGGGRSTGWSQTHNRRCINKANLTKIQKFGHQMGQCFTKEATDKQWATKIEKYGSKMGPCMTKEAQTKAKKTILEKYGDPMGLANTEEAKSRSQNTRLYNAYVKTPELLLQARLLDNENKIELAGTVYDICLYLLGKASAIRERGTILSRLDNKGKFKLGKWRGYTVEYAY